MKKPVHVCITGPAGQIGYASLFRICSGAMFGHDQPIHLTLLERENPQSQSAMKGVMMEIADCAFPLLASVKSTPDVREAFRDAEYALLIGARPRGPGMERSDLLQANAQIFQQQGRILNEVASRDVKVLVVGNPCNTNAYIAMKNAPDLSPKNFSALLRLDQNRSIAQLAMKAGAPVTSVKHVAVWGNHSPSMYPDVRFATVDGKPALDLVDQEWIDGTFIPTVAKRGSAIIEARGASSAGSAACAAIEHMRDWALGKDDWVTMGVPSEGQYGIPEGVVFGFPCLCTGDGDYKIVDGLEMDKASRARIEKTKLELLAEIEAVKAFIPA